MAKGQTAAIITAFNPSRSLHEVVSAALVQCAEVIVVDNSPGNPLKLVTELEGFENVQLIRSGKNLGLAGALNLGIAASHGVEFVMLLDQDSRLLPGTVDALQQIIEVRPEVAIVAPAPWDENAQRFVDPRATKRDDLSELDVVITSGMLLRTAAFQTTNGFRDDFFVDCVDQDFCLQLRANGWKILQDKRVLLPHSLGETRWHGDEGSTWIRSTSHPTWRLYWMARNGMTLSREYTFKLPRWAFMNLLLMFYVSVTVLLFEPPRWRRWAVFMRGIGDGLIGRRNTVFLPTGATDVSPTQPMGERMGGVKRIATATLIAGVLGYVITTVIARVLGAEYAEFAVYWSGLYLLIGALSGIQQEFARGLAPHAENLGHSVNGVGARKVLAVALLAITPLIAVGLAASSGQLFESNAALMSWAVTLGVVFQTVLFAITGFYFARHHWTPLTWVITGEIAVRLTLVLGVAMFAPSILNFAWASVLPFPVVVACALAVRPLRKSFFEAKFDASGKRIFAHIVQAVVATAGSAALTNGVPLVIATTGRNDDPALVSTVILTLILTRGPIVVGAFAFQSYLVVHFRRAAVGFGASVIRLAVLLLGASVLLAVAAALVGPQLLVFFAGATYQVTPEFIAILTLSSFSTGLLAVTGTAALGRSRHTVFVTGWLVGAISTIGMLFLPLELEARVLIALGCGPLLGVIVHLVGLARAPHATVQSANSVTYSVAEESSQ